MFVNLKYYFFILLVVSGYIFYFSITYNDQLAGSNSDDAVYLLLADMYTFSTNGAQAIYDLLRTNSYFPPVYPMILGLFGGNSNNLATATNITVTMQVMSFLISALWIYKNTGNYFFAYGSFLLLLMLPGSIIFSQELWSEFLFMIFIYGALLLSCKVNRDSRDWIGIVLLVALASLTRSIGIAFVFAFIIHMFLKKNKYSAIYSVACLLPFLFWNFIRQSNPDRSSYIDIFTSTIFNLSPTDALDLITQKILIFYKSIYWLFSGIETGLLHQILTNILLLIILTFTITRLLKRIRKFELDAIFLILYMAIVLIWPYDSIFFVSRFLYPIIPICLLYFIMEYFHFHKSYNLRLFGNSLIIVLIISVLSPSSYQYISRAYASVDTELMPYRRDRNWLMANNIENAEILINNSYFIVKSIKEIQNFVPENECIYSIQAPIIMLHAKRVSSVLPRPEVSDEEFTNGSSACNYILAMPVYDAAGKYPEFYPMQRVSNDDYHEVAYFKDRNNNIEIFLLEKIINTTLR